MKIFHYIRVRPDLVFYVLDVCMINSRIVILTEPLGAATGGDGAGAQRAAVPAGAARAHGGAAVASGAGAARGRRRGLRRRGLPARDRRPAQVGSLLDSAPLNLHLLNYYPQGAWKKLLKWNRSTCCTLAYIRPELRFSIVFVS